MACSRTSRPLRGHSAADAGRYVTGDHYMGAKASHLPLIFLTFLAPLSAAIAYDGNELLRDCNNYAVSKGDFGQGWCAGFINGLFLDSSLRFCPPQGAKNKQKVLVVEKYLRDHPELLHRRADSLIKEAFARAWPC